MLYEMITGVPPFDADEVGALLRMHVSAKVPALAAVAPDLEIPEAVEQLILHGLQKKADDRISSAEEYIERIDEILENESGSGLREMPSRVLNGFRGTVAPAVLRAVPKKKTVKRAGAAAVLVVALTAAIAFALAGPGVDSAVDDVDESRAEMMLGHADASAMRSMDALSAYEKAVSLEPRLARNRLMRTNVELMLEQKDPRVVDAALDFLGTLAATGDAAAADQLVDLASSSKVPRRRHTALAVADEAGLGDRVDRLGSYVLDLRQGETCRHRKATVAKLRALGNKRAIPALRKARKRIRSEGGSKKKKVNTNACLSADAAEAIRHLQSL
jgi:hypothetical protein